MSAIANRTLSDAALVEVAYLLSPLRLLDSPGTVIAFLRKLGYDVPGGDLVGAFAAVAAATGSLIGATRPLLEAETDAERLAALIHVLPVVKRAFEAANALDTAVVAAPGLAAGFAANAPLDELPGRLLDYLIFLGLNKRHPKTFGTLYLLGILDDRALPADPAIFQPECSLKVVRWDRISRYLTEPGAVIDEVYRWSTELQTDLLFDRMELVLRAMALPGGVYRQSATVQGALGNTTPDLRELRIPVLSGGFYPHSFYQVGLSVTPVEAAGSLKKGIAFLPFLAGTTGLRADLSDAWEAEIKSSLSLDAGLGISLRPPLELRAFEKIFTAPLEAGTLDAGLTIRQRVGTDGKVPEIFIFGDRASTHLLVKDISVTVFGRSSARDHDIGAEVEIKTIDVRLAASERDAFLKQILPPEGIAATFGFGLGFSVAHGVYFKGSAGIEVSLPVHIQLGPIEIQDISLAIKPEHAIIPVEVTSTVGAALGPLTVVVEDIGVRIEFSFPASRDGNLGPAQVDLGFKPPAGVGITVDAGIVKGGGYLFLDFEKGEYAGALQLEIEGLVSMSAIGLITTNNPDGTPGFSMLIIVTAEFSPPFQLSYGFTLNGVGGLLGINRTVRLDPLRDGVRTGAINGILFPTDVVANAPRILSDLRTIFPAREGYFLVAPMAKIGWGTPTLISLALGIIIQLPDPKIAILGVLKMVLPTEEVAVLKLQVSFLGTIDPASQLLAFDASLFDSNLLQTMTLTGDMAVRLRWGDKPDFVLSAGGFHPDYEPTMAMPSPERIGIKLLDRDNARIRVQTYFALTSNTVQFGARADCYFGIDDFSVRGYLGFDALMQFSPFRFKATCSGELSLDTPLGDATIHIRASLKGPAPWYVKATGSIKVLGVEFDADYEREWGQRRSEVLPEVAVIPLFAAEMQKAEVWHAALPAGKRPWIAFANPVPVAAGTPPLRVHPFGALVISQKLLPLHLKLDRLGNQEISDIESVAIESVAVGTTTCALEAVKDRFAVAQFQDLSDAEKLSRPSFEKLSSGVKADFNSGAASFVMGNVVRRSLELEQIYVDKVPTRQTATLAIGGARFHELLKGSAKKKSRLSVEHEARLGKHNPAAPSAVGKVSYTLGSTHDNRPIQAGLSFQTVAEAEDALRALVAGNPALQGNLTLVEEA